MRKGVDSKSIKEESAEKESGLYVETPRTKTPKDPGLKRTQQGLKAYAISREGDFRHFNASRQRQQKGLSLSISMLLPVFATKHGMIVSMKQVQAQRIASVLQIVFLVIAITDEALKGFSVKSYIGNMRRTLFVSLIFPSSLLVISIFWGIWMIDRELIFPKAIGMSKDRCKTPDSPEGARQATTPHSPSQSSPPLRGTASPANNGNTDSLTPPPPLPAAAALSLTLDAPRSFSDIQYGSFGGYPSGRQLSKLKKFLSTLVQFGSDISSDVGERVKSLVLNLVSSNLTIEEFHHSLQDVTNFPLRPFVLPFLRTHMPLLQREVHTLARLNKQSALQYVRTHDHVILEPTHSPSEASEIFMSSDTTPITGVKRRTSEGTYENGLNGQPEDFPPVAKRPAPGITPFLFNHQHSFFMPNLNVPNSHLFDYQPSNQTGIKSEEHGGTRGDEEWRNIHVMLNCILSMVEKTKRALTILQQRNLPSQPDLTSEWLRKQDVGQDLKKVANEIISSAIRAAEERVAEVKRKAEEAVGDVKRQAVLELQRAVAAAEARAGELLAAERARVEKALGDVRRQTDDATANNHSEYGDCSNQSPTNQPVSSQQNACWNCGRKAHDACSGCSVARYCGPFCQHKDWENHHQVCNKEKRQSIPTTTTPVTPAQAPTPPTADIRVSK